MKNNHIDFTQGKILPSLLKFILPVLDALILQAAYGAVDLLVIGRFHPQSVGAVGTGTNVMHFATVVIAALTTGATVIIGQHIGENNAEAAGDATGTSIVLFAVFGVVLTVILEVFARPFTLLLQIEGEEAIAECVRYVRICGAGVLIITAYNVISGILRGTGNANLPLLFVAIACVVNVVGDIILVGPCDMGAAGAAVATIAAQGVSVIISLLVLKHRKLPIVFNARKIKIFKVELNKILAVGGPIALQDFTVQISFMVVCGVANGIGTAGYAAASYAIAQKVVSFVMLIPSALSQSVSAFVAQNTGANQPARARRGMRLSILCGMAIGVFVCLFAFLRGDVICRLFLSSNTTALDTSAVIAGAFDYLRGFAPDCILTCVLFSCIGFFNGCGKSLPVMIQGISSAFLFRIPACILLSRLETAHLSPLFFVGLATPLTTVYGIIFFLISLRIYDKKQKRISVPTRA